MFYKDAILYVLFITFRYCQQIASQISDSSTCSCWIPCIITMRNQHSHSTGNAKALKPLPISEDTRHKLIHLFHGSRNFIPDMFSTRLPPIKMEINLHKWKLDR